MPLLSPSERMHLLAEIERTRAVLREADFPEAFDRWRDMTPEALAENRAAGERLNKVISRFRKLPKPDRARSISAGPVLTDPASIALKKEIEARMRAELKARLTMLHELTATNRRRATMPDLTAGEDVAAEPKTKRKPAKKPAAKKPKAKPAKKPKESKSMVQVIAALLTRPEGCTTADILKATGWPTVSVPAQAKAAKLRLRREKEGKVTRYFATA